MKKLIKSIFFIIISLFVFSSLQVNAASDLRDRLDNLDGDNTHIQTIADNGGMAANTSLPILISSIIKLILGLFGVIALIFIIIAGIKWMGSKGDAAKIQESRKIIASGAIGLAIIASSYALTDFIISQITATSNHTPTAAIDCSSISDMGICSSTSGCSVYAAIPPYCGKE